MKSPNDKAAVVNRLLAGPSRGSALVRILELILLILIGVAVWQYYNPTAWFSFSVNQAPSLYSPSMPTVGERLCERQLEKVRMAIQSYHFAHGKLPATLSQLHLPMQELRCPVGGEDYVYNPSSGRVFCPHPGHGNL
ncbi:MAG: hypothetical protein M1330_01685 [Armatimonadetes bacterium]|nr:hypothetical protein [Armatimonadota bacterium]